jgi:N utilization substance protein B
MSLAVSEMVEFPEIPVKVSLDEYIEIAKYYSTEKSNIFINGILDKIVEHLKENGKIKKTGRGLIGEAIDS